MIKIRQTQIEDASQVASCIESVALEKRFLANTEGFSVEQTADYIKFMKDVGGVHLVVVDDEHVVGWCDISPQIFEGLNHVGRLGMGLLPEYRHQGWGTKLLAEIVNIAFNTSLERIELEVFASNAGAIKLYRNAGFLEEGRKRNARKLNDQYDDMILFGLLRKEWLG